MLYNFNRFKCVASFHFVFFVVFNFLNFELPASTIRYSVTELPDSFNVKYGSWRLLNIQGQVAGAMNGKAAFWDRHKGVSLIPVSEETYSTMLNDYGIISVNQQNGKPVLAWNTNTNVIYNGPIGRALGINNLNDVFISSSYGSEIWNVSSGIVTALSSEIIYVNNNGVHQPYNLGSNIISFSINDNNNMLSRRGRDVFFYSEGIFYFISLMKHCIGYGCLNNNDEIFFLVRLNDEENSPRGIAIWTKNQKIVFSDPLEEIPELDGYIVLELKSANDNGELLISAYKKNPVSHPRMFLLSPNNL